MALGELVQFTSKAIDRTGYLLFGVSKVKI